MKKANAKVMCMDILTALLFEWDERLIAPFFSEVIAEELFKIPPFTPPAKHLVYANDILFPVAFIDPVNGRGTRTFHEVITMYTTLPHADQRSDQGVCFARAATLLLFAFDWRMQCFMFGNHGTHDNLMTRSLDSTKELRHRSDQFLRDVKSESAFFHRDLMILYDDLGATCGERVQVLTRDFVAYFQQTWLGINDLFRDDDDDDDRIK